MYMYMYKEIHVLYRKSGHVHCMKFCLENALAGSFCSRHYDHGDSKRLKINMDKDDNKDTSSLNDTTLTTVTDLCFSFSSLIFCKSSTYSL